MTAVKPDDARRRALVLRLCRIEGQVRGISRMIEDDAYCIEILTQVTAASHALRNVALLVLQDHMSTCVEDAVETGGEARHMKLQEASDAIARLMRS